MNIKTYILYIDENEKQIFKNTVIKNNIDDKDYIYFKGVDGNLFNESYLKYIDNFNKSIFNIDDKYGLIKEYITDYKNKYNKALISSIGAWGHLHSFIKIIEDAIQCNYDRIIIYEFDVIFMKNFNKYFDRFNNIIYNRNVPLIYLGASQLNWIDITINENMYDANMYTNGTFGIIIDSSLYNNYLELLKLMIMPSDTSLFFLTCPKKVIYPNLVIADISKSKIRDKQDMKRMSKLLKWNLGYYI